VPASNGNRIVDVDVGADKVKSNVLSQKFGIAIDLGDSTNFVFVGFVGGQGSDTDEDYLDENANCDHNRWVANAGSSSNPNACIPLGASIGGETPRPSRSNQSAGSH